MRPRLPLAKAEATGAILEHPARFKDRHEPTSEPLGQPSFSLEPLEIKAWWMFKQEVHWLTEADRPLVEVASKLRVKVWAGNMQAIAPLLRCLSMMGATPTDRSKVFIKPAEEHDPAEEFMQ